MTREYDIPEEGNRFLRSSPDYYKFLHESMDDIRKTINSVRNIFGGMFSYRISSHLCNERYIRVELTPPYVTRYCAIFGGLNPEVHQNAPFFMIYPSMHMARVAAGITDYVIKWIHLLILCHLIPCMGDFGRKNAVQTRKKSDPLQNFMNIS